MRMLAGLWIDHRKAIIVVVTDTEEQTQVIESNVEKQPGRFAGVRSTTPYESQKVQADDTRERELTGHLNAYYGEVLAAVHEAGSILIFGPGEAKGELKKRLEKDGLGGRIVAVQTSDKMTDRQVAARVRDYFKE